MELSDREVSWRVARWYCRMYGGRICYHETTEFAVVYIKNREDVIIAYAINPQPYI